jgi:hypothetical protein
MLFYHQNFPFARHSHAAMIARRIAPDIPLEGLKEYRHKRVRGRVK